MSARSSTALAAPPAATKAPINVTAEDSTLIDSAIAAVRDAGSHAPRDFLVALSAVLGALAAALLAIGLLVQGAARDLLLNLAAEVLGAWLTVLLIDGLWKRLEAGASSSLDQIRERLLIRRGAVLTDAERDAWRAFVREYGALGRHRSLLGRVLAVPRYGQRLRALEQQGNRTLDEFDPRRRTRDERL